MVVMHEMEQFLVISVFFIVFFVSLTTYRRLLLEEYHIGYFEYGYAVVESLILAKIILIGEAIHLGERFHDRPLIISTLWKTAVFASLVGVFTVVEHFTSALVHGRSLASALPSVGGSQEYELLGRLQLILIAFVPLFAFREVARVMEPGKLFELFFRRKRSPDGKVPSDRAS